jgi:hypothetical protein
LSAANRSRAIGFTQAVETTGGRYATRRPAATVPALALALARHA